MIIKDFSVDSLNECSLWYLLKNQYEGTVDLVRPTAAGFEPWTGFHAYRMFNGSVLLGFPNLSKTVFAQGLVAIGDGVTEYITTQAYERIQNLVTIEPPNDDLGTFSFVDSAPVPSSLDWRCDVAYYGPMPFPDLNGVFHNPTAEQSVLLAFEPIISVPGVGYIIYLQRKDFHAQRNEFVNNALTPMTAPTIGECFKLVHEWSVVAGDPFNNTEKIAVGAKKFCEIVGITEQLVSPYPNMQIAKFLQGHAEARVRPDNAVAPEDELLRFIQQNTAHMSLASILSVNPGVWDVWDIAELEQDSIVERKKEFFKTIVGSPATETFSIPPVIDQNVADFANQWLYYFDTAKELSKALMQ